MKVIFLAAGSGKRMWPIQKDKCLLPFLGKPLLYHNLKKFTEKIEADEVIIVARDETKDEITQITEELGFKFQIAVQKKPLGMADAILSASSATRGEVLVINAEDQLEPKVFDEVLKVAKLGADAVLAGWVSKAYFPGGYLKVTGDPSTSLRTGKVEGVVEKPGEGNEPSDLVKLVVDYFKDGQKLITYLKKAETHKDNAYEVALDQMIKDGLDVRFTKYDGVWIPLKYPWHVLDVMTYLLSKIEQKISPSAKIAKTATIDGPVVIEQGARIFEGAVVKGPVFIGRNSIVGGNCLVRESILEEGCVTGFGSDITRSYVGRNCWFHTNYVGDCVIEGNLGMGSGAVLANLRLDNKTIRVGEEKIDSGRHKLGLIAGSGVRIGVNTSIMPGVRIGSNSLIGPGVVLNEDVGENTKIILRQEYKISQHSQSLTGYDQFRNKLK